MASFFNEMKNSVIVRRGLIIIILSLTIFSCKESNTEFEVVIKTDADTDSLSMYPSFVSKKLLDSTYTMLFKGQVQNGVVNIKGNKPSHPIMFDIFANNFGMSDKFFIDNGSTDLYVSFVNKDKKVIIPNDKKSKTQKEYEILKKQGLDSIDSLWWKADSTKERRKIGVIRDTLIVGFLKDNPDSYVPMWLFANYFSSRSNRYSKLYDESTYLFSDEIKKTELFKNFKSSLKAAKKFSLKNKELSLKNTELENVRFKLSNLNNSKYILLDFWYSNCSPCLREMPKYIPIYEEYKDLGFEIVSISVDKTSKIEDWKKLIIDKEFTWIHYLDENGIETKKLNIYSFPTTFLINNEGEIIEKGITSVKLENFLSVKLD